MADLDQTWVNYQAGGTAISAEKLNAIVAAINARVDEYSGAAATFTVIKSGGVWPGGTTNTWTRPTDRQDVVFVLRCTDGVFPTAVTAAPGVVSGPYIGIDEIRTVV